MEVATPHHVGDGFHVTTVENTYHDTTTHLVYDRGGHLIGRHDRYDEARRHAERAHARWADAPSSS